MGPGFICIYINAHLEEKHVIKPRLVNGEDVLGRYFSRINFVFLSVTLEILPVHGGPQIFRCSSVWDFYAIKLFSK